MFEYLKIFPISIVHNLIITEEQREISSRLGFLEVSLAKVTDW